MEGDLKMDILKGKRYDIMNVLWEDGTYRPGNLIRCTSVFPGKLPQYVSGNLNIDPFYGSTVSGQKTERHNTTGTGDSDSDLYLFSRNSWRNQCLLCKNPYLGYHFTYY